MATSCFLFWSIMVAGSRGCSGVVGFVCICWSQWRFQCIQDLSSLEKKSMRILKTLCKKNLCILGLNRPGSQTVARCYYNLHFIFSSNLAEQGDFSNNLSILDSLVTHRPVSENGVGNWITPSNKPMLCIGATCRLSVDIFFSNEIVYFIINVFPQ